jgi:hypothetical protein
MFKYSVTHRGRCLTLHISISPYKKLQAYILYKVSLSPHKNVKKEIKKGIYWCVAYLPSEASIIEH